MKKWMLVVLVLAGSVSWGQAQIKIGNRTINTKKVLNAASEVASAITLSDEDVAAFTADTDFHELDSWSSLTSLSVVAMIIQEYGVELDSLDVRNADTIEELFEIVKSRIK